MSPMRVFRSVLAVLLLSTFVLSAAAQSSGEEQKRPPTVSDARVPADADGEATETQVWLDFARDCGYLSSERQASLTARYEEVGRMLGGMINNPERFGI